MGPTLNSKVLESDAFHLRNTIKQGNKFQGVDILAQFALVLFRHGYRIRKIPDISLPRNSIYSCFPILLHFLTGRYPHYLTPGNSYMSDYVLSTACFPAPTRAVQAVGYFLGLLLSSCSFHFPFSLLKYSACKGVFTSCVRLPPSFQIGLIDTTRSHLTSSDVT
jgi:hypothetical protein